MRVTALRTILCLTACAAGGRALAASSGQPGKEQQATGDKGTAKPSPSAPTVARRSDRPEPVNPFRVGEKLTYKVKWTWISAGYATMSVVREEEYAGRKAVRFRMTAKSGWLVSKFFEIDHVGDSVMDLETGGSLHFETNQKNGKRREFREFTVDPEAGTIRSFTRNHKGKEKVVEAESTQPVQDVVGFFYHLRTVKFRLGKHTPVTAFQGHKAYPLLLGVDGLEQLKFKPVGTFWVYTIHPSSAMPGFFSPKGEATIWIEQTTHTLVKMVVNSPSGTITMTLIEAEKSPLNAAPGAKGKK